MLKLDYNNLMSEKVGEHGVSTLPKIDSTIQSALETLNQMRGDEGLRIKSMTQWMALPYQSDKLIKELVAAGDDFASRFENVISLGIGGSYLGNRM
ncbi:MAG: hypothetical protein WC636_06260, partial [Candidatus Margulisiibacteriota bacterium]